MVTLDSKFFKIFGALIEVIEPYLGDVVFIGGVANALYEYHPKAQASGNPTLVTKDIDLATASKILSRGGSPTLADLLDQAGFKMNKEIEMALNLTKFQLLDENYEVEFLCPLLGRSPGPDYIEVQKGISAIPLRFMDVPLQAPWELSVSSLPGLEKSNLKILIPNPGAYIVQKFITMLRRSRSSAIQKDAYYVYEFCLKFRDSFPIVNECIDRLVEDSNYKAVKSFRKNFSRYFESQNGTGIVNIVKETRSLPFEEGMVPPDAATIHAVIQRFIDTWSIQ